MRADSVMRADSGLLSLWAMRFGAMFTLERPQDHGALKLYPKKGILQLTLRSKMGRDLFSEVAQARFEALAQAIGADPVVKHKQR